MRAHIRPVIPVWQVRVLPDGSEILITESSPPPPPSSDNQLVSAPVDLSGNTWKLYLIAGQCCVVVSLALEGE